MKGNPHFYLFQAFLLHFGAFQSIKKEPFGSFFDALIFRSKDTCLLISE